MKAQPLTSDETARCSWPNLGYVVKERPGTGDGATPGCDPNPTDRHTRASPKGGLVLSSVCPPLTSDLEVNAFHDVSEGHALLSELQACVRLKICGFDPDKLTTFEHIGAIGAACIYKLDAPVGSEDQVRVQPRDACAVKNHVTILISANRKTTA